jgi:histidine triad (HIT) family protein
MFRHAPEEYACPFCSVIAGGAAPPYTLPSDVVLRTPEVTAFISARWWPNNPGHVLVVPNEHVENIYSLPAELAARIHDTARHIALAFKHVYRCDGISTRQHNEPAGNQEVWHYHLHVFPRYPGDRLYELEGRFIPADERALYAERVRAHLQTRAIAEL